jgi:hypothetical protein
MPFDNLNYLLLLITTVCLCCPTPRCRPRSGAPHTSSAACRVGVAIRDERRATASGRNLPIVGLDRKSVVSYSDVYKTDMWHLSR